MDAAPHTHLGLDARQTQQQQQLLTPRQLQSLELLALPLQQLEVRMMSNPLIEEKSECDEELHEPDSYTTEDESLYEAQAYENDDDFESLITPEDIEGLEDFYLDDSSRNSQTENTVLLDDDSEDSTDFQDEKSEDDFTVQDFLQGGNEDTDNGTFDFSAPPEEDFKEELLLELNTHTELPENFRKLCETIIFSLDDNGLFTASLADIAQNTDSTYEEALRALEFIQELDSRGIGARNIQECWSLQLKKKNKLTPEFEKLFSELWDDFTSNRLNKVAQKLAISLEELKIMQTELSALNRYPITSVEGIAQIVFPEVEIRPFADGFAAYPLRGKYTYSLIDHADQYHSDAGKDFAAALNEAKTLLEAMEYRKSTLLRMAEMLIDTQREFFEEGREKLKPFTMRQAAEYLNVSESTVSRAAAEKYIKTPQGVLPLKSFFTAGYVDNDGVEVSRASDQEMLKRLIDEEDKKAPLSDEDLSALLIAAGHQVARRTVAKYRKNMNIPTANLRKKFF